jgi:hypothetical protein
MAVAAATTTAAAMPTSTSPSSSNFQEAKAQEVAYKGFESPKLKTSDIPPASR